MYSASIYDLGLYLAVWKPPTIASTKGQKKSLYELYDTAVFSSSLPEGGLCNRIDLCTAGFVLVAKNMDAYRQYQFFQKKDCIEKTYYATVYGNVLQNQCIVTQPLSQRHDDPRRVIGFSHPSSHLYAKKWYQTMSMIRVLEYDPLQDQTLIRIQITRGFRHQIRYHCAFLGHPIVGDSLYIPQGHPAYVRIAEPSSISLLCAGYTLCFS